MKHVSNHKRLNRIAVNKEAFIYLERLSRAQRGCKPLSPEQLDGIWQRRLAAYSNKQSPDVSSLLILDDESMGGGDGSYYGKWSRWSCADLKQILSEAGLTWSELEPIEFDCIDVYI